MIPHYSILEETKEVGLEAGLFFYFVMTNRWGSQSEPSLPLIRGGFSHEEPHPRACSYLRVT